MSAWLGLLFASAAHAHMPYLLPNAFDLGKREHVTVQASFTQEFFEPDIVMKADDYHVIEPSGTKQPVTPHYTRDLAVFEVATKAAGTYRISTGQRTGRTAKAAWVAGDWKFLERDEAPPNGIKAYDVVSLTMAEVYVTRGKPNETALAPRKKGLEFRPVTHPSSVFAGEPATIELLFDGVPLARHRVSVYRGGGRYAENKVVAEVTTDTQGRFTLTPDQPGQYVAMTRYRPQPNAQSTQGVSYTYSLVFEAVK
jgi:uncharacterized GH25 family protein